MIRKHNPDAAQPCPSTGPSADVSVRFGPADVAALKAMGRIAARAVIAERRAMRMASAERDRIEALAIADGYDAPPCPPRLARWRRSKRARPAP